MREVCDVRCGRAPARPLHAAPGAGGLLTPAAERLAQLVSSGSIHQIYDVENVPFARGQFASVRKCTHKLTGQRFAAKVLRKRRRLTDIYHEIAILDAFADCERIIQLHQVFETPTEIILVLELADGGELQELLDVEEFLREDHVIRLMRQILQGLHQLHDNNIAHLDIKPQNLLLTGPYPDCDVKLCDFGISRQVTGDGELREIMGTADYMAPEILNYEPLSLATDMWSIGVLTYALLTGFAPFSGDNVQETYCNITSEEVDFPDELFSDISDHAKDFIAGLLVKNPSGRRTLHSCLEHPWLSTDARRPDLTTSERLQSSKDSGFNTPVCSDDETSLPFTPVTDSETPSLTTDSGSSSLTSTDSGSSSLTTDFSSLALTDSSSLTNVNVERNGNHVESKRDSGCFESSSLTTGAYTIIGCGSSGTVDVKVEEPAVDNAPSVDNAPAMPSAAARRLRSCSPLVASVLAQPCEVTLELEPAQVVSARVSLTRPLTPPPADDDRSDATSEASTSDMSWEESPEFSYRRLSVAQLTDRVWDCFNEHDFSLEPVRPWENVCTGSVSRAKAMFSCKSAVTPVSSAAAVAARVVPRQF